MGLTGTHRLNCSATIVRMDTPSTSTDQTASRPDEVAALAASHGLTVDPASVRIDDAGLDYRVAHVRDDTDTAWVLRIPRRPELADGARTEALLLDLVRDRIDPAVPDWRIRADDLIAYPLVPGDPALTIEDGAPVWHIELDSVPFARAYGRLVGQLHQVPVDEVIAAGLPHPTIDEVRAARRAELDRVLGEFTVAASLREQWEAWLGSASGWPEHTTFTHGELYHAHILTDGEDTISGVLDWTTAGIGDPSRDLVFQAGYAPAPAFEAFLEAYGEAGGQTWPGLADHCAALLAFSPVGHALYALQTGEAEHREAARAALDPPAG